MIPKNTDVSKLDTSWSLTDAERLQARNAARAADARKRLGDKWLLSTVNRVGRLSKAYGSAK